MKAAVDNDVLHKGACLGLLSQLIAAIPANIAEVGILGAARFVVRSKLGKAKLVRGSQSAIQALEEVVKHAVVLEPTSEEEKLAAELEYAAQLANLNLDEGESLLCAIVILRVYPWLVTGDKRAVGALERVLRALSKIEEFAGKVLCLEQLFLRLLNSGQASDIREAVCAEPGVDRALAICFSCSSPSVALESWIDGLRSYIASLRTTAPTILSAE